MLYCVCKTAKLFDLFLEQRKVIDHEVLKTLTGSTHPHASYRTITYYIFSFCLYHKNEDIALCESVNLTRGRWLTTL